MQEREVWAGDKNLGPVRPEQDEVTQEGPLEGFRGHGRTLPDAGNAKSEARRGRSAPLCLRLATFRAAPAPPSASSVRVRVRRLTRQGPASPTAARQAGRVLTRPLRSGSAPRTEVPRVPTPRSSPRFRPRR